MRLQTEIQSIKSAYGLAMNRRRYASREGIYSQRALNKLTACRQWLALYGG